MADILPEFPERNTVGRYPWHRWFDGRVWKLKAGEDYPLDRKGFQNTLYGEARRRGGRVRTMAIEGGVIVQFFRPPAGAGLQGEPEPIEEGG